MFEWIFESTNNFIFTVLLLSRAGDVLTTRIATPTLKLEMNPVVRKLRWPFAYATLLIPFIAFYDINIATMLAVASLLVSASNATKMLSMKALGEEEYYAFLTKVVLNSSIWFSLLSFWLPCIFFCILAVVLVAFTGEKGIWIAWGFIAYSLMIGIYSTRFFFKVRKTAAVKP